MSKFPEWLLKCGCYQEDSDTKCYSVKDGKRELVPAVRINYKGSFEPLNWTVEEGSYDE